MRKIVAAAAILCGLTGPALATEGGASQYPNGAEDFMVGAIPPPGWYFLNYTAFYQSGRINDREGKKVPVSTEINVLAEVPRLVYTSPYKILGGNWGAHVMVPFMRLDATLGGAHVDQNGLGDITFDPFILSWHRPNFHWAVGLDINAPTGHYDPNAFANIGANYWGFEPLVTATYITDGGFELSGKFMYTMNTENDKTDYHSGDAFHTDYTIAQHFGPLAVGVGGYFYTQTTEDEQNGQTVGVDGVKGQVFAIGPQVKWDVKQGLSLVGKWQHEMEVENRPQGDKFWAKLMMAF